MKQYKFLDRNIAKKKVSPVALMRMTCQSIDIDGNSNEGKSENTKFEKFLSAILL